MSDTTTDLSVEDRIGLYFRQPNALYRESPHELLRLAMYELGNKDRRIESLQRGIAAQKVFEASWMKQRADLQRENEELKGQLQTLEYLEAERIEHADKLPSCPQCKSSDSVCHPSLMRSMIAAKEGFVCQEYERNRFSVEDEMAEWIRDLLGEQGCVF